MSVNEKRARIFCSSKWAILQMILHMGAQNSAQELRFKQLSTHMTFCKARPCKKNRQKSSDAFLHFHEHTIRIV